MIDQLGSRFILFLSVMQKKRGEKMKRQTRIELSMLGALAIVVAAMMLSCAGQEQLTSLPSNENWTGTGSGRIIAGNDTIKPFFEWIGNVSWYDPWDTTDGGDSSSIGGTWEDDKGHTGTFAGLRENLGDPGGQCEGTWSTDPPVNLQGTWVGVWQFLPHPGDSADVEGGYWYVPRLVGSGSYTGRGGHNWP